MLPNSPAKRVILGAGVSATSYEEVLRVCGKWIEQRRAAEAGSPEVAPHARYICVTSVHGTMTSVLEGSFRKILNEADVVTPDGMPLVWALRSLGVPDQRRVYGPDLMLALCSQAMRLGHRIYLYGGRESTLRELCRRLQLRYPGLQIAGAYSPPFRPLTPEEDAACVRNIRQAEADLVFVGLSTPKQERWMAAHRALLPGVVMIGVGAAFDFHAGSVRQAPRWMQQAGLEWLFRLLMEPQRLWKRYLLLNPLFIPLWALQWAGLLNYSSAADRPGSAPRQR